MGGKHYSARHIIKQFPSPSAYDTYCELFGGAAHVLMQKKPYRHVEAYNDINGDLVNFWMQCRDNLEALEERCRSLPYSREVYYRYHYSLWDGTDLEPLERAARWFYVLRSNFSAHIDPQPKGWSSGIKNTKSGPVHSYHSAIDLFKQVQERFKLVMIDNRDFAAVFKVYNKPRMLIYADPPYIGTEHYYNQSFTMADHERLADLLNKSSAFVVLSYYPHPALDDLYPADKWRRITWETPKHAQKTNEKHDYATELLLLNYPSAQASLWDLEAV
jgi:DNA adenine methylase